jgi:hypothetical protein
VSVTDLTRAIAVVAVVLGARDARAQNCLSDELWDGTGCVRVVATPASQMGHFPRLALGFGGGLVTREPQENEYSDIGGALGVEVQTFALTGLGLFHVEAVGNVLGDPLWHAHGRIVLSKGLGGRSSHKLTEVIPASETSPGSATTWNYLRVPMVWGVAIGGGAFGMDDETMAAVDVGFTLISPQYELTFAGAHDVTHGANGLRWAWLWTIPAGKRLVSIRMRGDHFLGDDADLHTMLIMTVGFTTSIGVRAVR